MQNFVTADYVPLITSVVNLAYNMQNCVIVDYSPAEDVNLAFLLLKIHTKEYAKLCHSGRCPIEGLSF